MRNVLPLAKHAMCLHMRLKLLNSIVTSLAWVVVGLWPALLGEVPGIDTPEARTGRSTTPVEAGAGDDPPTQLRCVNKYVSGTANGG